MVLLRRQPAERPTPTPRHGVRASAQRQTLKGKKINVGKPAEWQAECAGYFDAVGEVKQLTWLQGNVMAKIRLYIGVRDPDDPDADPIPASDPAAKIDQAYVMRAQAELDRLQGPLGGPSEICRELNMNLEITGEANLVGRAERTIPGKDGEPEVVIPEEWAVYSVLELVAEGSGKSRTVKIKSSREDQGEKLDLDRDSIIRIWQRHPLYSMEADCALRGALSELETLVALRNQVKATARSHMPAGYLTLPNELSMGPANPTEGEDGDEAGNDPFEQELIDGALEPIEDPGSAAAYAPTFLRGPAELLDAKYIRHISLARTDDPSLAGKITECILAIARALNAPVEKTTGLMATTFANAATIKQDEFDEHLQPRCVLIVDALTVGFLHPNLAATAPTPEGTPTQAPVPDDILKRLCIWYDPSAMIAQPNLAEAADAGLEHDALSWEAWRRIKGASEDDAPDAIEMLVKAALKNRTFDPGISTAILELLDVPLNIPTELPGTAGATAASASIENLLTAALTARRRGEKIDLRSLALDVMTAGAQPALPAVPTVRQARSNVGHHLMLIDRELRSKVQTAASDAMTRVLEKAGHRLRGKTPQNAQLTKGASPFDVARLLGPTLVAAAGVTDDDLIGAGAFASLEQQFLTWGAQAQARAIETVNRLIGLTGSERDALALRQAADLSESWSWFHDQLHDLARAALYAPDPLAPAVGEFDPTSRVPTGLIRQALSRAGGATGLTVQDGGPFVVLNNGQPPGGIATGELVMTTLTGADVAVEGYEWVYGPAFRIHPFEDHEALDGETFDTWDSDVLSGSPFDANFYPGDHDGCACDAVPVLIAPEDVEA